MSNDEDGGGRIWAEFRGYPQSTQRIPQPAANFDNGGFSSEAGWTIPHAWNGVATSSSPFQRHCPGDEDIATP